METTATILCLAYIIGLLSTVVPWIGFVMPLLGLVLAIIFQKRSRKQRRQAFKTKGHLSAQDKEPEADNIWQAPPKPGVWLVAGIVAFFASLYLQMRIPFPAKNDVSKFLQLDNGGKQEQVVTVKGFVTSTPRLTRNKRGQFWLDAKLLDEINSDNGPANVNKGVSGKLYVTVPLLQATAIYPGQEIAVTGVLYKPQPPANPGSFNFQEFLKKDGAFAGLSGRQVTFPDKKDQPGWGWWQVRARIVRSQVRWLGIPEGPLVSSMVLGSKAVDLPYDIRDLFVQAGLAHALAASGFQTSLILGVVLGLTRNLGAINRCILGSAALIIFALLAGFQPSVLRAVIMGFAALIGLALERKVKLVGSLLIAATILLLFNPLWIWDLGFQLSFLATLGLIVTVPALTNWLQWLPPAIASLIAVPLAASIWTLPLQLHVFGVLPVYSLLTNIVTTPLISLISIGGIISALASVIWSVAGSAIAWLLYYPTHWLIQLVEYISQLPGNSFAIGTISLWQLILIYGLFVLVWLLNWWNMRWWLAGLIAVGLVFIPIWQTQTTLFRVTVLATRTEPVLVVQEQGRVTLFNSGDDSTARFTVLPFLQQQGVNQVDWAISVDNKANTGWMDLLQRLPVRTFYDYSQQQDNVSIIQAIKTEVQQSGGNYQNLAVKQKVNAGSTVVELINEEVPVLQFQVRGQNWLLVGNINPNEQKQLVKVPGLPKAEVLWWAGDSLSSELVKKVEPKIVIASSNRIDPKALLALGENKTQVFWTGRDGAIQWTPSARFESVLNVTENQKSIL
ncbi:MAG: ComEC/Rec2 family competence protein [Nostocaceae cyanobacterium]|nr:ComEC/Rec2 family competence protein [Nostocaceae cyanobacterium]